MALEWDVAAIYVDGSIVRVAFSAAQAVTDSAWGVNTINPAAITISPYDLEVVGISEGEPAYCGVVPLKQPDTTQSGVLQLLVKTSDSNTESDWDSAATLLESGLIDLSLAIPNEPIYWAQFQPGRYGQYFRLYYDVREPLENAVFYSFITNQPSAYQHLAFVQNLGV